MSCADRCNEHLPTPAVLHNRAMSDAVFVSLRRVLSALLAVSVAVAQFGAPLRAQETAVRLSGVISDLEDAPLEGVRIELVEAETWAATQATTDVRGRFQLEVPAGRYRTRVSYHELEIASEEAVELTAGTSMRMDVSLHVKKHSQ